MSKQQSLEQLLKQTQSSMSVHDLIRVWRSHKVRPWSTLPELYLKVGKKLLSSGEVLLAHQVLSKGLETIFPPPRTSRSSRGSASRSTSNPS